jgi:penicillin-binding protein 1C
MRRMAMPGRSRSRRNHGRALLALAAGLWLAAFARDRVDSWIDATILPPLVVATSVEVRDRDGALLRAYTVADGRWRLGVSPTEVDPFFLRLLLAYEDNRFYTHSGVDPWAMLRAAGQALMSGHVVSGASTLTMQVARLLEDSGTGQFAGKLRQMRLALALERHLTKDQILAIYLQLAPYGGNIEGIRGASRVYFGKEPRRLTPAEAALLVAIPQSPETRRPDRALPRATAARDRVLDRATLAGLIDPDQATAARREPVPDHRRAFPQLAPHLADRARTADPTDHRRRAASPAGATGRRCGAGRGRAAASGHRRRRSPHRADSGLRRLGRVSGRCAAGVYRHDHGDSQPRFNAETADLWAGL